MRGLSGSLRDEAVMMQLLPSEKGLSDRSQIILLTVTKQLVSFSIANTQLAELHCWVCAEPDSSAALG